MKTPRTSIVYPQQVQNVRYCSFSFNAVNVALYLCQISFAKLLRLKTTLPQCKNGGGAIIKFCIYLKLTNPP